MYKKITLTNPFVTSSEPKQCCSVRTVLWYLVFTGMAVNYMTRINLNIALVSMVLPKSKTGPKLVGACTAGEYVERMPHSMGNETVSISVLIILI